MSAALSCLKKITHRLLWAAGIVFFSLITNPLWAQQTQPDTTSTDTGKALIHVLNNEYGEFIQADGRAVQKLMYHVKLRYGSDTMYCDSAFFYTHSNSVEAFGDVAVVQADGTSAFAEYMRYTGFNDEVYMRSYHGDVELDDGKGNTLWSREIRYNLKTKIGSYIRGGTLQSDYTVVSSQKGIYHLKTKEARFKKDVVVNDPDYRVVSKDLSYNTKTKVVTFNDTSTVTNNASILKTTSGIYNAKDSISHFTKRSAIWNGNQFVEADTLDYNHSSGLAKAYGRVIVMDTLRKMTLFSGYAQYNEYTDELLAYKAPLVRIINNRDSLYLKADTFYGAPIPDSLLNDSAKKGNMTPQEKAAQIHKHTVLKDTLSHKTNDSLSVAIREVSKDSLVVADSNKLSPEEDTMLLPIAHQQHFDSLEKTYHNQPNPSDTNKKRYFIAYHHVRLFSDSLSGRCDSMYYSDVDSFLRMYKAPFLWPRNSQISGEVIYLKMDSSGMKKLIVPKSGILVQRSGPTKADMFNQIQGDSIKGYFDDNRLSRMTAAPHAQTIYYVVNDAGAYVGCSQGSSREVEILFDSATNHVQKIYYRQNVKQTMTPMKAVTPTKMRLSRFVWKEKLRPKNLNNFLIGTTPPMKPVWQ